jgi:hypothetical protein
MKQMEKSNKYRQHARECRELASRISDVVTRETLLQMAETWEALSVQREIDMARQERIRALEVDPEKKP